jgi:hypothetical protein
MAAPSSLREALAAHSPHIVLPGLYRLGQSHVYARWEDAARVLVTDLGNTPRTWLPGSLVRHGLWERDGAVVAVVPLEDAAATVAAMAVFQDEVQRG